MSVIIFFNERIKSDYFIQKEYPLNNLLILQHVIACSFQTYQG